MLVISEEHSTVNHYPRGPCLNTSFTSFSSPGLRAISQSCPRPSVLGPLLKLFPPPGHTLTQPSVFFPLNVTHFSRPISNVMVFKMSFPILPNRGTFLPVEASRALSLYLPKGLSITVVCASYLSGPSS